MIQMKENKMDLEESKKQIESHWRMRDNFFNPILQALMTKMNMGPGVMYLDRETADKFINWINKQKDGNEDTQGQ